MASKYYYHMMMIRLLLIVLTTFLLWWSLGNWPLTIVSAVLLVAQVTALLYTMNQTNRKISFFFEAIKNDDSTLFFPVITNNRTIRELNNSLNEVNELVKQIRQEVQTQEKYYQMLLEQAETGILSIDEKGHIKYSNRAARNYLQVETLTHINQFQRIDQGLWEVLKSMEPGLKYHLKFQTEKDRYDISLKSSRIMVKNQKILLVVLQDIRSEMEDKEAESWIKLIRVLTHEIMNSISPITSLSETLTHYLAGQPGETERYMSDGEKLDKAVTGLNVIREQSQSLLHFVESYRNLTRLAKPDIKPFAAVGMTGKLMTLCQTHDNFSEVDLVLTIDPPDHVMVGDQDQIVQVLMNIVKNAYESVAGMHGARIIIGISASIKGTNITVKDNGPGILPENLSDVFTPFFTTKESGTGIGLSLSKQIIRNHGGTLTVQSKVFEETNFTIELP
ncbi:MAG: ATP-binding protein [Bacteroidales bacterium]|jgi:nitrogen fixation/metabolism regulation signal transduction histidine kinase